VDTPFTKEHGHRYGYYFWVLPERGAFSTDGHGGQYIFIVPERELVIVMTAEPHTTSEVGSINLDPVRALGGEDPRGHAHGLM